MSSEIALSVKNVSKCFEMYEKPVHRLYQTLFAGKKKFYKEFWALKDINFEIRRGECVGIIGRNGAGKSTLLQIVTGTLAPTTGEVKANGRVAALLELGSGFNPEFTGRENVYLNGSILGLSHEEIEANYQKILDFADIGEFIDQPVKTYSSGMMVRLAFAVQVMVDPDILIVDEALAVGDAAFQRKCFARMDELVARGVTVILVTHDTETVKRRCSRAIFLRGGSVAFDGSALDGVTEYMHFLFPSEFAALDTSKEDVSTVTHALEDAFVFERRELRDDKNAWGIGGGVIESIRIRGLKAPNILSTPAEIEIEVDCRWNADFVCRKIAEESLFPDMMIGIRISDAKNVPVYGTNNSIEHVPIEPTRGRCTVIYRLKLPMLKKDEYFVTAAIGIGSMNNHLHLVWDDLAIQLHGESETISDGMFYCETDLSVR